jgi:hypothetical protein
MLCCATDTPVILGIESSPTFEADAPCVRECADVLTEEVPNYSPQRSIGAYGLEPNILSATHWLHHPDLAALLYLPCCLLLACVWPIQAHQKEPDTRTRDGVSTIRDADQLIQLEKQWAESEVKGGAGFFERIAASDYVIVDCDGSVRNK